MELRDIEIFLVLAEELHFGRTAARLHVSQARVSQAVKAQERRIGAPLFDRTSRRVRLTSLGRQLRNDLRPVYAGLRDSLERARLAAQGITAVLHIGMLPINVHDLSPYWDTFRSRHPAWDLRISHPAFADLFGGLRRGEIDVLVAWLPIEEPDLTVGPILFAESRVLAIAAGHELAERTSVSLETVGDFQHVDIETKPDYWFESYVPSHTRKGRVIERGPLARNTAEILTWTGMGEAVALFPSHMTRYWVRQDVAYLPVHDVEPLSYALVWRSDTENDLIRALARTVRDLGSHLTTS